MRKDQIRSGEPNDLDSGFQDGNGIAEVPLTDLALQAFESQLQFAGEGVWLFPSSENPSSH